MTRKKIPRETEIEVLTKSGRRCTLCFGLNFITEVKLQGQIAHLDGNPLNNNFNNLCYMCLNHHDQYDTNTSQSKGLQKGEIYKHRKDLYQFIEKQKELVWADTSYDSSSVANMKNPPCSIELYERRLMIYHAVTKLLGIITSSARVEHNNLLEFILGTEEALFLFDEEFASYLTKIYQHGTQLYLVSMRINNLPVVERPNALVYDEAELLEWFSKQYEVLREKMKSYSNIQ